MSRIVTLRPAGTVTGNAGSAWKNEASVTFADAHLPKLGDEVASTLARVSDSVTRDLDFELDTYTKASNERFFRARLRLRAGHTTGPAKAWLRFGSGAVINGSLLSTSSGYVPSNNTLWTGPWINVGPTGVELTQSDVDSLRAKVRSAVPNTYMTEFYLDVEVKTKPVVTVPPPVQANGKASITPTVNWTLNDPTDTQTYFQIKVFTKAVAEAGGFSPDNLTHIYMTGVSSSYLSHAIPSGVLAYGNDYYVFVKSWTSFSGVPGASDYESDWSAGTAFHTQDLITTTVTAPADPVTNIDSPTAAWAITNTNGDTYGAWKLRLFTAAQYGIAGFDPATSPATYEASSTTTVFPNHQLPRLVNGTTYRVYVQTTTNVYLVPGFWEYKQFTMSLTQPPAPTMNLFPIPGAATVGIEVLSNANLLPPASAEGISTVVWQPDYNCTTVIDAFFGAYKQRLVASGSGDAKMNAPAIPAQGGRSYSATANVVRYAGSNRNIALTFKWLDAAGATIGGAQGTIVAGSTTPANPTITATAPAGTESVQLGLLVLSAAASDAWNLDNAYVGAGGSTTYTQGFGPLTHLVERSDDQGATWQAVRAYPTALGSSVLSDYEAPFNTVVQYRASSITTISGSPIASNYATASTTLSVGVVWIKNPLEPEQNAHVYVDGAWLPSDRYKARQVQKPLGSTKPKVIRGDGDYESFSVNFLCLGDAMHEALEDLLASDQVLCIQSGKKTRYVEVSGNWSSSEYLWDDLRAEGQDVWKVTVPFVEVAAP